jgi:hypothetical protein
VRIPATRDQLPGARQAQLTWGRIEGAETEQPVRGLAADIGAVVVVLAYVVQVVVGEAPVARSSSGAKTKTCSTTHAFMHSRIMSTL